jgi:hypothetical protein
MPRGRGSCFRSATGEKQMTIDKMVAVIGMVLCAHVLTQTIHVCTLHNDRHWLRSLLSGWLGWFSASGAITGIVMLSKAMN